MNTKPRPAPSPAGSFIRLRAHQERRLHVHAERRATVRAALEKLAAAEIMSSPEQDSAARSLREALSALAGSELDFVGRVEADLGFHLLLCRLAGNSMLVEAWRNLEGRIRVAIMNGGPDRAPRMMSWDRHAPIVDAIESGDLAEAVRVIDQHMTEAADHFCGLHG